MITETQARALASLLHELRPDWAPNSLMTLIGKHKDGHGFPDLCKAAVQVATNPEARTPALIFLPGPHWAQQAAPQQYLTAAEKRLEQGRRNHDLFVRMDADRGNATGTLRAMAALQVAAQFREQEAQENTHD